MQLVSRTFPVNSYLRRIDKHVTGHCPWCPGVSESMTHMQSCCPQFADHRTAAHHSICRATMAAMKDARPKHWQFFYETPLSALPVPLAWADDDEATKEADRRPDGVAYNSLTQQL
eukprot:2705368-Rhodomonas_salina.1